jgi:hypothetical protein
MPRLISVSFRDGSKQDILCADNDGKDEIGDVWTYFWEGNVQYVFPSASIKSIEVFQFEEEEEHAAQVPTHQE